jgi:RNA-binding protein YlmH
MDENELIKRRIKELAERASRAGYATHTVFLSTAEQNLLHDLANERIVDPTQKRIGDVSFFLFGGYDEAERKVIFFIPFYQDAEEEIGKEKEGKTLACLHFKAKDSRYAEELTHRDYLGALMSLGYERSQFGDILVDKADAYVFLFKAIEEEVRKNLLQVKHTFLHSESIAPKDCPLKPQFDELLINIQSPRLDAVIAEVYHLSRLEGKELVEGKGVFLDGALCLEGSRLLKGGEILTVKGFGKCRYLGEEKTSRKGRLFAKVICYR